MTPAASAHRFRHAARGPALLASLGLGALFLAGYVLPAQSREPAACPEGVDAKASMALQAVSATSNCSSKMSNGYPLPDPACTPGAVNPTVTVDVLKGGAFKTSCERDHASSAHQKAGTYEAYAIVHPENNRGTNQTCELDHLVSIELGGADTVDNIWPQCGPEGVELRARYFKIKDSVENYLAAQVRAGKMDLTKAQHGIATDWTQYIGAAQKYWRTHNPRGFGRDE